MVTRHGPEVELPEHPRDFAACVTSSWNSPRPELGVFPGSSLTPEPGSSATALAPPQAISHSLRGKNTLLGSVTRDLRVHGVFLGHTRTVSLSPRLRAANRKWAPGQPHSVSHPITPAQGSFVLLIYPAPQAKTELFLFYLFYQISGWPWIVQASINIYISTWTFLGPQTWYESAF